MAALVSTQAPGQAVKLGELNSYKVFAAFLEPYRKGMELAVEEINAAGGVLGRKVELVVRDDGGNPGDAVRVAERAPALGKIDACEPVYLDTLKDETPEGWWVTGYPWADIGTPEHKKFLAAYRKRSNDYPRQGSVVGYTAVYSVFFLNKKS